MIGANRDATSPADLWRQAGGGTPQYDPARYRQLMVDHGHLVPGKPEPLPCGWRPGQRPEPSDPGERTP